MVINYKSSKELQLLLLFLSCPKFLSCISIYFRRVIIVCKGHRMIARQGFTQRVQSTAFGLWPVRFHTVCLGSHCCSLHNCTAYIWCIQLCLISTLFYFHGLALCADEECYQSHPQQREVRSVVVSGRSTVDDWICSSKIHTNSWSCSKLCPWCQWD